MEVVIKLHGGGVHGVPGSLPAGLFVVPRCRCSTRTGLTKNLNASKPSEHPRRSGEFVLKRLLEVKTSTDDSIESSKWDF